MNSIKDLIYFDETKAQSLVSQLKGGLVSEISNAIEGEINKNDEVGFNIKIVNAKTGSKATEKVIRTEKITLYHEMLAEIESALTEKKLLTSIDNKSFSEGGKSFNEFILEMPNMNYIKANGWGTFEDFNRIKRVLSNFNEIQRLINTDSIADQPNVASLKKQLSDAYFNKTGKVRTIQNSLDGIYQQHSSIHLFDDMWIERVKMFLDTFSPSRLNFRLIPLDDFSHFQILANLKPEHMVNGDIDNTIFTYGSRPNIKLSVFGIITSCPQENDARVNALDEFLAYEDTELSVRDSFDKAFRSLFQSFEEFEHYFFTPQYPKIAISPIAIYREIV